MNFRSESSKPILVARRIIQQYGIDRPEEIDLHTICFDYNIFVIEKPLRGSLARLIRNHNDKAVIRVSDSIREEGQKRYAIAHEFGHFLLHKEKNQLSVCLQDHLISWYQSSPEEKEANNFASELLMPEFLFQPRCVQIPAYFSAIENLKDEFNTSLTATTLRYIQYTREVCALIVSVDKKIRWFRKSDGFPLNLFENGTEIDKASLAARLMNGDSAGQGPTEVPALAWADEDGFKRPYTLQEDAVYMRNYNTVLSLISIKPKSGLDYFLASRTI